ncbi:MAG: response regulator [Bryobacterales bacterium]|nr:response regulator [Bryobacterales bacterium]
MRDMIVIGASAGGVTAVKEVTRALPAGIAAAIVIVMHRTLQSCLPELLATSARLRVQAAADLMPVAAGNIYIAPPDHQLSVENGLFRVDQSPREGTYRPSINALFRSAATEYGRRAIGVILSGALNDGVAGLWQIKKRGGVAVVQDPAEALFPDMPKNAIQNVPVDFVLPVSSISEKLIELSEEETNSETPPGPVRILIVEDEAIAAEALKDRFHLLGYEAIGPARFGEDAVQLARNTQPDLVVMDIQLAGPMTGIEAARLIWAEWRIPIVYITAFANRATFDQVNTAAECYGYVAKPFHTNAVHAAIELALKRQGTRRGGERRH